MLFIKTTPNDEIVIMPNIFEKMPLYWANNGMIIKTNDYIETYKSITVFGCLTWLNNKSCLN